MILRGKLNQVVLKPVVYNTKGDLLHEPYAAINLSLRMETEGEIESIKRVSDLIQIERILLSVGHLGASDFSDSMSGEFRQITIKPERKNSKGEKISIQHAVVNINLDMDSADAVAACTRQLFGVLDCEEILICLLSEQPGLFDNWDEDNTSGVDITHTSPTGKTQSVSMSSAQLQKTAETVENIVEGSD